MHCYNHRCRRP